MYVMEAENVIPEELHHHCNKMLPAMHCMRCGGCPSLSAAGIYLTDQSQGSPVISAATSHCIALLLSLLCHFN